MVKGSKERLGLKNFITHWLKKFGEAQSIIFAKEFKWSRALWWHNREEEYNTIEVKGGKKKGLKQ